MYTKAQVQQWFTHPASVPAPEVAELTAVKNQARDLALVLVGLPPTHETQVALDRLQEAVMWAQVAITRGAQGAQ